MEKKKNSSIRVSLDAIFFRDLRIGDSDSVDFWVQNTGKTPIQFRFSLPPSSPFKLIHEGSKTIAPGLDTRASIKYTSNSSEIVKDTLSVICPVETIKIPITATPPCPRIIPVKNNINLGNIGNDTDFKFIFSLSNVGMKEGEFNISCTDESVSFSPNEGSISPEKSLEIAGDFHPKRVGDYSFTINIITKESQDPPSQITVTAKSLPNSLSLQINGSNKSEFEFGTIYFGQKRIISASVVNNGPYKRTFVILPPKDTPIESSSTKVSQKSNLTNQSDIIFSAYPSEGLLNSYEKKDIKLVFNPPIDSTQEEDLESTFSQFSSLEVVETGQKIDFTLAGKAVKHFTSFSQIDFDFDKIEVDKKTTKTLKISNDSHYLPLTFEFHSIAQFRFEPSKGQIASNSSKEVKITFHPRNYGFFTTQSKISFNDGLFHKYINLKASCGPENGEKPFKRVPVWETEKEVLYSVEHPDTRYSYDLNQIKENMKKKADFDAYITDLAETREKKNNERQLNERCRKEAIQSLTSSFGENNFTETDIQEYIKAHFDQMTTKNIEKDLGIQPMEGLTPPDPPLRKKRSLLFIENPGAFGITSKKIGGKGSQNDESTSKTTMKIDDNKLIKKKFKSKATTPAEINECNRTLTAAQQLMIVASHQTINIGQISVFSTVTKSFSIENNLQQHIIVSLDYEYEELSKSSPSSQVIPPKQTAGFDLKFTSHKPQNFMKTIQYQINGRHSYSFTFVAQVIPIDLQINQSFVEFRFSPDSIDPVIKEFVTLSNKSNSRAEYNFTGLSPPFSMNNAKGFVEANKSLSLEITYNPGLKTHDEQDIVMNTLGGSSRALKLIGDTGNSKCSLQKKTVNFGLLPIGIAKTQSLRLKNTGEDDAIFAISAPNSGELQVSPMNGKVIARDSIQLQITYKSLQPHPFNIPVSISICGSQPLTFNVIGQSELPQVQLENTEFEFGRVFVGSSASIETTISNIGAIPAILALDLRNHPEFRIEFPTEYIECGQITIVSDSTFVTKMETTTEYIAENDEKNHVVNNDDENKNGLMYQIQLSEHTTINFSLIFQPIEICDVSFELPISMMNIINTNAFHLQPIVSAEGVQAPISLSTNSIDFGVTPIYDSENPNSRCVVRKLSLLNESKKEIRWHFDDLDEDVKNSFIIEPMKGQLNVKSSQSVHISFTPKSQMPYNVHLPLYVESEKDNNLIGKVQLIGVCSSLPFRISLNEVCLPVIPLNTVSQMQVYVINQAFIEGELKVQIACDENKFPLKISFPEGNVFQHTTEKVPLLISFQSPRPISFSTLVAVLDNAGNAASFSVSCTADNSCLTLYPYLSNNPVDSSPNSPKKKNAIDLNKTELNCRFINVGDYLELKNVKWEPKASQTMIKFVQRYMNALVLTNQILSFPDDLIANQAAKLVEAVSNLTGLKKNAFDEKATTPEKRCESIRKILHSLISNGALLSSIKPEFLLDKNDFMHLMRQKVTRQLLGIDYFNAPEQSSFNQQVLDEFCSSKTFITNVLKRLKVIENLYNNLSIESWMIVLMQLFKLFIMPRVETDKFESIPGITEVLRSLRNSVSKCPNSTEIMNEINKPSKVISASNIFSIQEMTLLKWSGIHYANATQDYERKFNDFSSFTDSQPFLALIKDHTSLSLSNLNKKTNNDHSQKEQNAIELINSMKSLKLAFYPQMKEILDSDQSMIAITLSYLIDTLPHYIPQATIEFQTVLHKPITKMVSISNPSKSEVTYKASFEGNNNFVLTEDSITISAGQTAEYPIFFHARTIKQVSGRLSLIPSRPRFVAVSSSNNDGNETQSIQPHLPQYSAPIVIDVLSAVSLPQPDLSLTIETAVYQPKKFDLSVVNKFGMPTNLTVLSKITKIEDENGRPIQDVPTLQQEMLSFINSPLQNDQNSLSKSTSSENFENEFINRHQMLILSTNLVAFSESVHSAKIEAEFVPIQLGTFRCLILFSDQKVGEFIYEVVAKSTIPQPTEVSNPPMSKLKIESGKKASINVPLEMVNSNLSYSIAYSIEKRSNIGQIVPDRKMRDLVQRKQREVESSIKSNFVPKKYSVITSSPQYFEIPSEVTISKSENKINSIPVSFKPIRAGDYPCKFLLISPFDIRSYFLKGTGLAATKELNLDFQALCGQKVIQEIPLRNVSKDTWQYKITLTGDSSFTSPQRLSVKPNSDSILPITFSPSKIGLFQCEVQILNMTKEMSVIYKCTGNSGEPPTEDKFVLNVKARERTEKQIEVRPFIKSGTVSVTSTVPIITFDSEVTFENGQLTRPFYFSIFAPRSGISVGTITFTDQTTQNFIWYVVEIHVDSPKPEETIEVTTEARKSVTVSIPIRNTKSCPVKFTSHFMDDDLFGPKEFMLEPDSNTVYQLVVCPMKSAQKCSAVYFYSDDGGEFWYRIKIDATEPPISILAPLTASVGKTMSTFILLSNPTQKVATYKVENDNKASFSVVLGNKRTIALNPGEERRIEVKYIPSSVGKMETASISFISAETGDWRYKLNGTGKPPQPLSPTIVSAAVSQTNSALVLFRNPFNYQAKFNVAIDIEGEESEDDVGVFSFLNKRRVFTLNNYNEETQIPFTFQPKKIGQYKANIVVASMNSGNDQKLPSIRWIYPIIGNSHQSENNDKKALKCRAHENCEEMFKLTLIGEMDSFKISEYSLTVALPEAFEFVRSVLDVKLVSIEKDSNSSILNVKVKFSPQRPLRQIATLTVRNPLGQEWQFLVDLIVELGKVQESLTIESLLNKTGNLRVKINEPFRAQTPFHAYFVSGSASEFSVLPEHGIIEPTLNSFTELPLEVIFAPKMYGKVFKGTLVIDTIEAQFLFDICGKTPEYVPPVFLSKSKSVANSLQLTSNGPLNDQFKKAHSSFDKVASQKKKNFIRENIEKARIVKPRVKSVINKTLKFYH